MTTHLTVVPGFSSRSSVHLIRQFPQRDQRAEDAMKSDTEIEPGFSNSEHVEDAPQDVRPDVQTPDEVEPGFSNSKAVTGDEPPAEPEQAAEIDADTAAEDKTAAKKAPAKKSAAGSAAKKKG